MRALRLIVAVEAAMLAVAVGLVLHSEGQKRFPPSVAVSTPLSSASRVIPVSVDLGSTGRTKTATALVLTRGGQAVRASAGADAGIVGFRRAAHAIAGALPSRPR
jgi:hypothetical protein